jgi:transcriptional regulator with XRE-family HTH domain
MLDDDLTIGQRVRWYRNRRGLTQRVVADRVGRSEDWQRKVEAGRIPLHRRPVLQALAKALSVSVTDLLGEATSPTATGEIVHQLRASLVDYTQLTPLLASTEQADPIDATALGRRVGAVWDAYQDARFGYVTAVLPALLRDTQRAARDAQTVDRPGALASSAMAHHAATSTLTKLREPDLAWIAADRGLRAAEESGDLLVIGCLLRAVVHALLAVGKYDDAIRVAAAADNILTEPTGTPTMLSVYGTLQLGASMAAARAGDRSTTRDFLRRAADCAALLGGDRNEMWTAFGPTNVAVHRVATAMELGDVQTAVEQGPRVDTSQLPTERHVRHSLEVARALTAWNRVPEALDIVLDVEQLAPEQVRYHFLSHQLVTDWLRTQRGRPRPELACLADRIGIT